MYKALPYVLSSLLLAGCDGTLVFSHPQFVPSSRNMMGTEIVAELTPQEARIGDTLTLRVTGLSPEAVAQAYINPALISGGDPEDPVQRPDSISVFRLGRLNPAGGVATLSFELRSTMGNDQFGNPFTLTASQSWTILITEKDQYGRTLTTSGGKTDFTIL